MSQFWRLMQMLLDLLLWMRRVTPPDPLPFQRITKLEGNPMKYRAEFPAFPAPAPNTKDIVIQRFTSTYEDDDGVHEESQDLPGIIDASGNATEPATSAEFVVPADTIIGLRLTYVDDDGLSSKNPAVQSFKSGDNIDPADPGDFGAITVIPE